MDITKQYEEIGTDFIKGQDKFMLGKKDQAKEFIKKQLPDLKGKTLLDLGCGHGKDIGVYENLGAKEVFGVDSSKLMIEKAKEVAKHPERLIVASMESMPFKDEQFDVITGRFSIHYLGNLDKTYLELDRILKKKGILVITVHHPTLGFMQLGAKKYRTHEIIKMNLYNNAVTISFPHHTLKDYFSEEFFKHFVLDYITEESPLNEEYPNQWDLPGFIGFRAVKRS